MMHKEIYEIGEVPPLGARPRGDVRAGDPRRALRRAESRLSRSKKSPVPELRPDEALVYVMAAGVNYNNVWASLGTPVDVIARAPKSQVR